MGCHKVWQTWELGAGNQWARIQDICCIWRPIRAAHICRLIQVHRRADSGFRDSSRAGANYVLGVSCTSSPPLRTPPSVLFICVQLHRGTRSPIGDWVPAGCKVLSSTPFERQASLRCRCLWPSQVCLKHWQAAMTLPASRLLIGLPVLAALCTQGWPHVFLKTDEASASSLTWLALCLVGPIASYVAICQSLRGVDDRGNASPRSAQTPGWIHLLETPLISENRDDLFKRLQKIETGDSVRATPKK